MSRNTNLSHQRNAQDDARAVITPPVDIYENPTEILLVADLPGATPETLKVNLEKEELTVEANAETSSEGANTLSAEFEALRYARRFRVPSGIDAAKVSGELRNGVLWLRLPKQANAQARTIPVKTA